MKKSVRRLKLHREAIRILQSGNLAGVIGGDVTDPIWCQTGPHPCTAESVGEHSNCLQPMATDCRAIAIPIAMA